MRDPRQRMPVGLLGRRQRPADCVNGQPLAYVRILRYVAVIVVIHERMPIYGIVKRKCRYGEKQTYYRIALLGRRKQARRLARLRSFFLGRQQRDLITENTEEHRGGNREGTGSKKLLISDC